LNFDCRDSDSVDMTLTKVSEYLNSDFKFDTTSLTYGSRIKEKPSKRLLEELPKNSTKLQKPDEKLRCLWAKFDDFLMNSVFFLVSFGMLERFFLVSFWQYSDFS